MPSKVEPTTASRAISRIAVSGFKSIHTKQAVEIRPLTILAGANSSGKSSMMQTLLLLKQTLEAPYDPGPLLIFGPNVKFSQVKQMFFHSAGTSKSQVFEIELDFNGTELRLSYSGKRRREYGPPDLVTQTEETVHGKITLNEDYSNEDVLEQFKDNTYWNPIVSAKGMNQAEIIRNRCFLEAKLSPQGDLPVMKEIIHFLPGRPFVSRLKEIIHVPGLRGNPERAYPVSAIGETFPGTFEAYAASVIAHWGVVSDSNLERLGEALGHLGLTWKVHARAVDDTKVELRVGRLIRPRQGGASDLVNIADVGFGISQTLPVVVALLTAVPGQMVFIEQPEIHLHPRAQVAMAEVLARAAKRGVRVVIETHSALLLLGIQSLVAEGSLPASDVALHWFLRDPESGITTVRSAELDEAGRFGDWPEDFDDVALEAESRYLSSAEARIVGK
jgi:predicted ATPase